MMLEVYLSESLKDPNIAQNIKEDQGFVGKSHLGDVERQSKSSRPRHKGSTGAPFRSESLAQRPIKLTYQ